MKISISVALFIVGVECLLRGAKIFPQSVFSEQNIWLWYVMAIGWFLNLLSFLTSYTLTQK